MGKIRLEDLEGEFPDPDSYRVIIEQRGIAIEGNTVVVWNEIANRTGFIGGNMDWDVNFGLFASGDETYRLRPTSYDNGELICPPQIYQPDSTCAISFDVSIDILDPKLVDSQLYTRKYGTGDPLLDSNWRTVMMIRGLIQPSNNHLGLLLVISLILLKMQHYMYGLNMTMTITRMVYPSQRIPANRGN